MKLFAFAFLTLIHAFDDIKIEIVNTTKTEDNNDERKDLMQDWENLMSDFLPDDMVSFDLKKGQVEILEEHIPNPTNVRGAYFITLLVKDKIDFVVTTHN